MIASSEAVTQFEKLLGEFGGPLEKARWAGFRKRLMVVHPLPQGSAALEDWTTQRVLRLDSKVDHPVGHVLFLAQQVFLISIAWVCDFYLPLSDH